MHRIEGANNVNNLFSDGPPGTVADANWFNAIQEEIANAIEQAGLNLYNANNDPKDQLWQAITSGVPLGYDYIVKNTETFIDLFSKVSANTYKIKDGYESVYFKKFQIDYDITDILTGGDTYAVIQTNNCATIFFESNVVLDVGDTASCLNVNTDYCSIENLYLKGTGTSGAAFTYSISLNADHIRLRNCIVSDRKSNAGSRCNFIDGENLTTTQRSNLCIDNFKLINCEMTGAFVGCGFNYVRNCNNIVIRNFTNSSAVAGSHALCIDNSQILNNLHIEDVNITGGEGQPIGIYQSDFISNAYITDLDSDAAQSARGISNCDHISGASVTDIASASKLGITICNYVSSSFTDQGVNANNFVGTSSNLS